MGEKSIIIYKKSDSQQDENSNSIAEILLVKSTEVILNTIKIIR